jgi:hypothetical protein
MATIEHKGKSYEVDEDGFLLNGAESWDQDWVEYVKGVEGISDLTEEHQKEERHRPDGAHSLQDHRLPAEADLRAVPVRPRQGSLQDGRPAETDRLRLILYQFSAEKRLPEGSLFLFHVAFTSSCRSRTARQDW